VFENCLSNGWKLTFLTPHQMASDGFHYYGTRDPVTCSFFKTQIDNWQPGVDPLAEHERLSPQCLFLFIRPRK